MTKKTAVRAKNKKRYIKYGWSWRKIADIYGVSPTTSGGGQWLNHPLTL